MCCQGSDSIFKSHRASEKVRVTKARPCRVSRIKGEVIRGTSIGPAGEPDSTGPREAPRLWPGHLTKWGLVYYCSPGSGSWMWFRIYLLGTENVVEDLPSILEDLDSTSSTARQRLPWGWSRTVAPRLGCFIAASEQLELS